MAYVNTTLWGIPARIIRGNTLTLKTDAEWKNLHWHRVGEDMRRKLDQLVEIGAGDAELLPSNKPAIVDGAQAGGEAVSEAGVEQGQFDL